jgi:alpha-N-acetylglucosamine transferase
MSTRRGKCVLFGVIILKILVIVYFKIKLSQPFSNSVTLSKAPSSKQNTASENIPEYSINSNTSNQTEKFLATCLNNVTYENRKSVWTIFTEGIQYAEAAVKLLRSVQINTDYKFDAVLFELVNKPLPKEMREMLMTVGWKICQVERIAPRDEAATIPRYRDLFTKLHVWKMIEYESVLFLDSDCLVVNNINFLFEVHQKLQNKYMIGVTRDIFGRRWRSWFNIGVFVIKPSVAEFDRLIQLKDDPNFEFDTSAPEQNFLNAVYRKQWFEIGFVYNANLAAYTIKPHYWRTHEKNISIIHYTMHKPWACKDPYTPICEIWRIF